MVERRLPFPFFGEQDSSCCCCSVWMMSSDEAWDIWSSITSYGSAAFDAEKMIKKSNQIIPDNFNNTPQVFGVSLDKNYDENKCNLGVECVMFAGLEFPIPFVSLLTRFFY